MMPSLEGTHTITGQETRPAIRTPVPGKKAQIIIDEDTLYIATTTKTSPIAGKQGRGPIILTEDGNVFLDFTSGIGVTNTGHCHPTVVKAVQDQAAHLLHFAGTDFYYEVQSALAKELAQVVPGSFAKKSFFTNSGTESNEAAIKIVRWSTQRPQFLAFSHAFHGRTMGSLGLTSSKTVHKERFFPMMPGVHTVPYPNPYRNPFNIDGYDDPEGLTSLVLGLVEDTLDGPAPPAEVGAFFAEPVQGEGGYVFPPSDFFRKLKKVLDAHGILLVADEVQTGFGRTGRMFAMEHYGVTPPITTMAKAMGSGLPIGAAVFDAKLDFGVPGAHSNTFGGNLVACAAARATLRVFKEEKLLENANRVGDHLGKRLRELAAEYAAIGDVRGRGMMWAIDFVTDRKTRTADRETRDAVIKEAYTRGLVLLPCGKSSIRVIPPLNIKHEQVDGGIDVLRDCLRSAVPRPVQHG